MIVPIVVKHTTKRNWQSTNTPNVVRHRVTWKNRGFDIYLAPFKTEDFPKWLHVWHPRWVITVQNCSLTLTFWKRDTLSRESYLFSRLGTVYILGSGMDFYSHGRFRHREKERSTRRGGRGKDTSSSFAKRVRGAGFAVTRALKLCLTCLLLSRGIT